MKRAAAGIAIVSLWFGLAASCADYDIKNPPANTGGAGGSNTGGSGGAGGVNTGGGPPAGCQEDKDCPVGPCEIAHCVEGTCQLEGINDLDTDHKPDALGDCKKHLCDKGALIAVEQTDDVPDDGNDCTQDTCDGMNPQHQAVTPGTNCSLGYCYVNPSSGAGSCEDCGTELNCGTQLCVLGTCVPLHCADGQFQGVTESDIDCGKECRPCGSGQMCAMGTDCETEVCTNNVCAQPSCTDGKKNGTETAEDCGGDTCETGCGPGYSCIAHSDCESKRCYMGYCHPPSCKDNLMDGDEEGVDCGGTDPNCLPCPP